jgi:phosphatidylserine decarboxylase
MVKDGYLYGLGLLVVAAVVWFTTGSIWLILLPVVLALFFLWFFRDPERVIPQGAGLIVSPADGLVTEAEWVETTAGSRLRVSIFLNVFNVHVNRNPISGTVKVVDYRKGGFMNAMNPESVLANEQTMIVIEGDGYEVAFKQIAGLLARRIVCNLKAGDRVVRGTRMGLIKFGSRCDVLMPAEANLRVKVGTKVTGGLTVLAALTDGTTDAGSELDGRA